jgi:hypothetical protein
MLRIPALLACLVVAPIAARAQTLPQTSAAIVDYYDGLRAWEGGERIIALGMWSTASEHGDIRSMRKLAELYEKGEELPTDAGLAYLWNLVASKRGDASADEPAKRIADTLPGDVRKAIEEAAAQWVPLSVDAREDPQKMAMEAVLSGDSARLIKAMDAGAVVTYPLVDGQVGDLLLLAVAQGNAQVVKALLKRHYDPMSPSTEGGIRALHLAAGSGRLDIVQEMLEAGLSPLVEDDNGTAPHEIAEKKGDAAIAKLLKDKYLEHRKRWLRTFDDYGFKSGSDDEEERLRFGVEAINRKAGHVRFNRISIQAHQTMRTYLLDSRPIEYASVYLYDEGGRYTGDILRSLKVSQSDAIADAMASCSLGGQRKGCVAYAAPKPLCLSIALPNKGPPVFSLPSLSRSSAEGDAMRRCNQEKRGQCRIGWKLPCDAE